MHDAIANSSLTRWTALSTLALVLAACAGTVSVDAGDTGTASDASNASDIASTPDASSARACPAVTADAGTAPAMASIDSLRGAAILGVARTTRVDEECSGAGGAHLTVEWISIRCGAMAGVDRLYFGSHAYYPMPRPMVGDLLAIGAVPDNTFSAGGSRDNAGWCLNGLPTVQGRVVGWWPVSTTAEGESVLDMIAP